MAEKNTSEEVEKGDSEEIIERLDPSSDGEDGVDIELTGDEIDGQSVDGLSQEDRKSFQKGRHDEVQKLLSRDVESKASSYRMRSKEPSEIAFFEEIAKQKTVEEIWEEPKDEAGNRKSIIVMCFFITLIVTAGGWALWQSTNDERGNEDNLTALENASKEKELEKRMFGEEISLVSGIIDQYFAAITVSKKSEYIYQAELFKNDIEAYYETNGGVKPLLDYSIENIFPISLYGEQLWEVFIKNEHVTAKESRRYYVRKNSDGEYKVDWKADVVFQGDYVKNFIKTRSREATSIKFIVKPADKRGTYNWGFKDTEYKALRLVIPDSDIVFWGYVKKDSQEQEKLNRYIESDLEESVLNQSMRHEFILKVRFLVDSPNENDQYVLIEDVASRKWVNIDE